MRALVQRVTRARCRVGEQVTGEIGSGLVVLLGASTRDGPEDADWTAHRVAGLRVFADEDQLMNRDVREVGGGALVIPQFTLYGDVRRGRRPDFVQAARPEQAEPLYERFCKKLEAEGVPVARGQFRAHMRIELENDGPVTLLVESPLRPPRPAEGDDE